MAMAPFPQLNQGSHSAVSHNESAHTMGNGRRHHCRLLPELFVQYCPHTAGQAGPGTEGLLPHLSFEPALSQVPVGLESVGLSLL